MPALDRGTYLQLAILLLIIPAQYFLTQWKPTTSAQRSIEIERLLHRLHTWQGKFSNPDWWRQRGQNAWKTLSDFMDHFGKYGEKIIYGASRPDDYDDDPEGESPAYEVLKFRESNGYFGGSTDKRSPRPKHVKFRIGQVVRHTKMGYRGVIVGWDLTAKAPAKWLKDNIPPNQRVQHPQIDEYFEAFDGSRFLARSWLKKIYPHDQ